MPRRTLILATNKDVPPHSRGGAGLCALRLAQELGEGNLLDVRILSGSELIVGPYEYNYSHVDVRRVARQEFAANLRKMLQEEGVDAVVCWSGLPAIARVCDETQVPMIPFLVDYTSAVDGLSTLTRVPAATISVSGFLSQLAQQVFGISPLPFPPCCHGPSVEVDDLHRFGLRTVGLVNPNLAKGGELLKRVANELPSMAFTTLMGWASSDAPLVQDFPTNVMVRPWAPDPTEFYDSISVLLVPSLWPEGFGRVAREAALRGIPVIASDRGGLKEATCNRGFHLNPWHPTEWVSAIRNVLSVPGSYCQIAQGLRRASRKQAKADAVARKATVREVFEILKVC